MLVFRLATRNLSRQWSRNAVSMVSIIVGVFVIVAGRGFQGGLNENMIRGQIDAASGHVVAVPDDYPTNANRVPVEDAFPLSDDQRRWLDDHTEAWTSRLIAGPRAIHGRESMRIRLTGAGEQDEAVFPRDTWKIDGAFPAPGADEILVATGPAGLLGIEVGSIVTLEARTVDGAINAMRYTASGIVSSGNPMIDNMGMFVPLADADRLLAAEGRRTHVASLLASRTRSEAFAAELEAAVPGVDARTWQEEIASLMEAQETRQVMFDTIGLALLLMAATGIANTVLMAAFERVREIGTLRSMGLQRTGILSMFAFEGFWMGLIGGIIGAVAGGALCYHYSQNGISMVELMGGKADAMGAIPIAAMLYLEFSPATMVTGVVVAVLVAVLASVYPAISASGVSPAEAVRAT